MSRMKVNLAGVELKNPVMTASGTFGSGAEYSEFVDLNKLGAVVTKGVANVFCERDIPFLKKYDTKIIVNVCGKSTKDYCEVVERLGNEPVYMLEINVSCPNVKEGGIAFGQNPKALEDITKEVKKYAKQPVIMKLSPNVTDITEMAKAAEAGGADVLSLINTLTGMKIDINRRTFALANKTGGMSGPAWYIRWQMRYPFRSSGWVVSQPVRMHWSLSWQALLPYLWEPQTFSILMQQKKLRRESRHFLKKRRLKISMN